MTEKAKTLLTDSTAAIHLLELNRQGFIPGPEESDEAFFSRVAANKNTESAFYRGGQPIPREVMAVALQKVAELYDISPHWVPAFFSDKGLSLWHGGGATFVEEEGGLVATLQIRRAFATKKTFLGYYTRDELLAHELVHIGRMAFDEPAFEEAFAYQTAPQRWRRWLGPLIRRPWEAALFVGVAVGVMALDLIATTLGSFDLLSWSLTAKALPLALLGGGLTRAWRYHRILSRCLSSLHRLTHDERTARAIAYRLSDKEIVFFAHASPEELRDYIDTQQASSLRWQQILAAYHLL